MPQTSTITLREERLTRYILHKRLFSVEKGEVKPGAFLPPRDLRLSVFRTSGIDDARIWNIGNDIVAGPQG